MVASTDLKARLFDLFAEVMERVREGNRDGEEVANILQAIKDGKNFRFAGKSVGTQAADVQAQLVFWQDLYLEVGIKLDLSNLKIPTSKTGFNRLIVVAEGLTSEKLIKILRKYMKVWVYREDLDVITSVRKADQTYAIWVRDRQEADEELKNKSAEDLEREDINGITLPEQFLYVLKYFRETGRHLDEKNITLCSGSRDPHGDVPSVDWYPSDGGVRVCWDYADSRSDDLRSREAVS